MIKEKLIELVQLNLAGGDTSEETGSKYDIREIELYVGMVYDDLIMQAYIEGRKTGDFSFLDDYAAPFKVSVLNDEDRDERYIVLPVNPVTLPDQASIRLISPYKNQNFSFNPMESNSSGVWDELDVDIVDTRPSYYVEGLNVYFDDRLAADELMVKLVQPFSNIPDSSEVYVPGGKNTIIFDKVKEMLASKNQFPRQDIDNQTSKQV